MSRILSWISFSLIAWLIVIAVSLAACPKDKKPWDHRPIPGHRAEQIYER